jgi:SNF2 family DNA or RNA helicase
LGLLKPRRLDVRVPMGPAQTRLYKMITDHAARSVARLDLGDGQRFRAVARSVMHLLQAASDPALLNGSEIAGHSVLTEALTEPPPKIMKACEIARRLAAEGKKTVIWTSFVNTVEHVAAMLQDLGAEYIHGGVDTSPDESITDSREAKLKRFHDHSECMVLIANPAACAEGISLHMVCHHAIYIDRTYNAAHYLQSEDRIHRLGLPPNTETDIIVLRTPGTVDDSVQRRLADKVATMERILEDPDLNITPADLTDDADALGLTEKDIIDLKRLLGVE